MQYAYRAEGLGRGGNRLKGYRSVAAQRSYDEESVKFTCLLRVMLHIRFWKVLRSSLTSEFRVLMMAVLQSLECGVKVVLYS